MFVCLRFVFVFLCGCVFVFFCVCVSVLVRLCFCVFLLVFFPQTVWLTPGVLTVVVKGRGARSEVANGFRRYFRAFVLRCAFFLVILVLSEWRRAA